MFINAPTHLAFRIPPRFYSGFWTPHFFQENIFMRVVSPLAFSDLDLLYLIGILFVTY